MNTLPSNISKLCILRLSAIGDVCHAAAMVERIVTHAPHIQVTWIVGKVEYQLLKGMPNVRFIVFDKRQGKQAEVQLLNDLDNEKFDALLLMQVAFRANWVSRLIQAKVKIGFDWQRSKEMHWLFANKRIAPRAHAHVLEGFMGFADALGVPKVDKPSWSIPMSKEDIEFADALHHRLGKYVVISPAASKAERNWSSEGYAQAADYARTKGYQVVLCGGPSALDKQLGQEITESAEQIDENLIGKTSLKQMLAVLQRASLVIAPDTGPAHMATTVGTPVIGLYAHSNPRRTGPYNNLQNVVSVYDQVIKRQTGKDWQELPWGKRAKGDTLMSQISIEDVTAQMDALLE
ncbi:glycosyltransferase family 9 protein [Aliiglaciecola litoralis]